MSNPYSPNQQPAGGNGQYPAGQQYTQQIPVTGGYQQQGYAPQSQQGYYLQGQLQGAPYGGQPEQKSKTGLIIGTIAAVVVVILVAGAAIWALVKDDSSDDESSALPGAPASVAPTSVPSADPSPSTPVAPVPAPTQSAPPVGAKPSPAPAQRAGSSGDVSIDEEYDVKLECRNAISSTVVQGRMENWIVERDGVDASGNPRYISKGQFNGTLLMSKSGTFNFTCTAVYHKDNGLYEAWAALDGYQTVQPTCAMIIHPELFPGKFHITQPWWKNAVLYQVYPRSFQDMDGDGLGDLEGIFRRLDYLADLGVDIVWVSPIYRSPQADNGYSISDYRGIDPLFGDLGAFDTLITRAHALGIYIVMDLIVNHTSIEHPWFVGSASSMNSERRDWYYWRDPCPDFEPGTPGAGPTNWEPFFGGPTWEYDASTGQYYLRLLVCRQPDLNWENPHVRDAVYDMMNWWLDRGADGFRVDAIDVISKLPDLPDSGLPRLPFGVGHECFADEPRLHEFLQEMHERTFAHHPGSSTVGEASNVSPETALLFCDPERRKFNMLVQFEHVNLGLENGKFSLRQLVPGELADVLTRWQDTLGTSGWNALYLENHDQPCSVSRFGDSSCYWYESATALATVYFLQCGTPFVYQGRRIGMFGGDFMTIADFRDVGSVSYMERLGIDKVPEGLAVMPRDNGRTPMQWDSPPAAGFSEAVPWIDVPASAEDTTVTAQVNDPQPILTYYRALISARHVVPALTGGTFSRIDASAPVLFIYHRSTPGSDVLVMVNLSGQRHAPLFFPEDEAMASLPWHLYLGNTEASQTKSDETGDHLGSRPAVTTPMKPWETRVYLLVGQSIEELTRVTSGSMQAGAALCKQHPDHRRMTVVRFARLEVSGLSTTASPACSA